MSAFDSRPLILQSTLSVESESHSRPKDPRSYQHTAYSSVWGEYLSKGIYNIVLY